MKHRAKQHASEVAQLKFQLSELSAQIRQKEKQEINLAGLWIFFLFKYKDIYHKN